MNKDSERANAQYEIMNGLQIFYNLILAFFLSLPWLVIAWYFLTSIGTPEPAWWNELETALGIWW